MVRTGLDRGELISALNKEFNSDKDILPYVEQSKYISSTGSLSRDLLKVDRNTLANLSGYLKQLKKNLEEASKTDYSKLQSALYVQLADRCVEYVMQEQLKS